MTRLTDKTIRAAKPKSKTQYAIADSGPGAVRGLSILINPGGTKVFYFRFKNSKRIPQRIRIGNFPGITLSNARTQARTYKRALDEGEDIFHTRRRNQNNEREIHTISDLWDRYYLDAKSYKKSADFENSLWKKHLEPYFGKLDVNSFSRDVVLSFIQPFRDKKSPALGARVQAIISQLGSYAVEKGIREYSPAYQLGRKKPLPCSKRFLNRYELAVLWYALSTPELLAEAKVSVPLACALKTLLLTAARRTEVAGMTKNELDFQSLTWLIDGARTKNGRDHLVPLSPSTLGLVQKATELSRRSTSIFIFPGRRFEVKP